MVRRGVQVGQRNCLSVQIVSAVNENDRVIVHPDDQVYDFQQHYVDVANEVTAPVVVISNSGNGAKVNGMVRIQANVSNNVNVSGMQLYIDGKLRTSASSASLSFKWQTRKVSAGVHSIEVKAQSTAGVVASQSIQVFK